MQHSLAMLSTSSFVSWKRACLLKMSYFSRTSTYAFILEGGRPDYAVISLRAWYISGSAPFMGSTVSQLFFLNLKQSYQQVFLPQMPQQQRQLGTMSARSARQTATRGSQIVLLDSSDELIAD